MRTRRIQGNKPDSTYPPGRIQGGYVESGFKPFSETKIQPQCQRRPCVAMSSGDAGCHGCLRLSRHGQKSLSVPEAA
ncbi:hypothetical protein AVEN_53164-1 [Araneus ventricosus]|uniref:Uncharacterized protein n=1 Tax=Araneus ventricosus TaxID=182803 RepID=A0A4Y2AAR2_ARAVE|nr:hypothetical protein AVEN_53164-1 [Araneus ventricosus]